MAVADPIEEKGESPHRGRADSAGKAAVAENSPRHRRNKSYSGGCKNILKMYFFYVCIPATLKSFIRQCWHTTACMLSIFGNPPVACN